MKTVLEVKGISAHYGKSQALWDVSISVESGEAVALLGPNAAGKSTTLNCISRLVNLSGGHLSIKGQNASRWSPQRVVAEGLVQVPEGRQLFPFMTVQDNLDLGAYSKRARRLRRRSLDEVFELLPLLKDRRKQISGTLSGGEQQMLAIGRALMARPQLLMLDEPSLGLSPVLVQRVFDTVRRLHRTGLTILVVEQNVAQALRVADRAYILDGGITIKCDSAESLQSDPEMRKAYLGTEGVAEVVEHSQSRPH